MQQRAVRFVPAVLLTLGVFLLALGAGSAGNAATTPPYGSEFAHRRVLPQLASDSGSGSATATGFEVLFLDVGQGDAILVTVGNERLLIDGGRSAPLVLQRLKARGVNDLDAILATHPDADHIGGLAGVLTEFTVERIYLNGGSSASATYTDFVAAVNREGAQVVTPRRGQGIPLGGLQLPVLHPGPVLSSEANDNSLVLRLTCGGVDVLFAGDAGAEAEQAMLATGVLTDVEVLKVGHHGSATSSTQAFLQAVRPEVAVISAGLTNQYGHPHASVISRLAAIGATLVSTDTGAGDDTVRMTSDCVTYSFSVAPTVPGGGTPGAGPSSTRTPTPSTPAASATGTNTSTPTRTPTIAATPTRTPTPGQGCDPSYPTLCLPPPPPDLDCGNLAAKNFPVFPPDPHRFDTDRDGIGCES